MFSSIGKKEPGYNNVNLSWYTGISLSDLKNWYEAYKFKYILVVDWYQESIMV